MCNLRSCALLWRFASVSRHGDPQAGRAVIRWMVYKLAATDNPKGFLQLDRLRRQAGLGSPDLDPCGSSSERRYSRRACTPSGQPGPFQSPEVCPLTPGYRCPVKRVKKRRCCTARSKSLTSLCRSGAESPGAVRIGHPERSHLVEYLAPNSVFNSLPRQRSSPHLRPDDRLVTIDRVLHHASLGVA